MGELQERHFISENNRKILYTDTLQKHEVYSEVDCAAYCARNDNCVIATFDQVTLTCYTDVEKNTSLTTGPMMNWTVLYKIEPKDKWWQRICYDNPSALLNCLPNEEIMVSAAIYGNLACMSGTRLSGFPNCGKYVTETLTNVCNRKETCAITVNSSTFGTTNCGGSENLFVDYECYAADVTFKHSQDDNR
ncbi:Hypothetical predicted protein [Mytilus galloprovincialis]|uniref:SUEL-type lectin domain-containing protein n=1 Tax=Mytilus galloprovincialis TaxID=29158 RepID=A0A8B6DLS6_MYTGA|nr:Hypothetical predicted protein [Mytilus galloprovincialis]